MFWILEILWDNRIIHLNYKPSLTELIQDKITQYYWKKWLSRALFFTITSQDWKGKISSFSRTPGYIIHNGFDPELFEGLETNNKIEKEFTIIHAGSLYEHQNIDIFLNGCVMFLDKVKPKDFKVKFIGTDRVTEVRNSLSGYMYEPKAKILSVLNEEYCEVTNRIPKKALAYEMKFCQLLYFPGLVESPGTHLGKIFDYLGSGKNILMVPDDYSVVGELIKETNTGFICNSSQDVCDQITQSYNEWKDIGHLNCQGNQEAISKYTREFQVKKMAAYIDQHIF